MSSSFDPTNVNLSSPDLSQAAVVCYLEAGGNDYDGRLGARISALFVILICSTVATFFPVVARRYPSLRIPLYVYLFARYFGSGVIVATAFIHLLDPAYGAIGPNTCVGMTGNWAVYSWPPALAMLSAFMTFLMDFGAELYVETKYGVTLHDETHVAVQGLADSSTCRQESDTSNEKSDWDTDGLDAKAAERSFHQQIAALLILEFGVIFHSVIIGLNLGVAGSEFSTLYPVLIFHQSFEGLGIGARMSAVPFKRSSWLPWILCLAYGLTTPISIAIGLGVRTTYNPNSMTANIVSGVLDSLSAGILIYTGLVELLARDFLFDPNRTNDRMRLGFMMFFVILGMALMALLGKWA
jgi:solute carrier family 39 (zinc transporter), member 1/2/3